MKTELTDKQRMYPTPEKDGLVTLYSDGTKLTGGWGTRLEEWRKLNLHRIPKPEYILTKQEEDSVTNLYQKCDKQEEQPQANDDVLTLYGVIRNQQEEIKSLKQANAELVEQFIWNTTFYTPHPTLKEEFEDWVIQTRDKLSKHDKQ